MILIEKILLLDNDPENIQVVNGVISRLSRKFQTFEAPDTDTGLKIVTKEKIQLVIAAWETQPLPGTSFCQKIRLNKSNKVIPFLLYSKEMGEDELRISRKYGYENILLTPLDPIEIRDKILVILDQEENMGREEKKLRKIENLLNDGDPAAALKYFDPSLNKPIFRVQRDLLLCRVYLLTKKFDQSQKILDALLKEFPENISAIRLKAKILFSQGRKDESCELLKSNLKKDSEDLISAVYLISQLIEMNLREQAETIFSEMLNHPVLGSSDSNMVIPLSVLLYIEIHGGSEIAKHLNNFALIYSQKNELDKAILVYKKGVFLLEDPIKSSLFQYNLALALKKTNNLNDSFRYFCNSYLCNPDYEKAYIALVKVSRELKALGHQPDQILIKKVKQKKFDHEKLKEHGSQTG